MATIFIITEGEYSDYRICGIFDNKELAEKHIAQFGGEIESWELNKNQLLNENEKIYHISMDKNGDLFKIHDEIINWYDREDIVESLSSKFNYAFWSYNDAYFSTYIITIDEKSAIKIANDRRIRLIVEGIWK